MGVFTRFTDIINSNINALLDKAEDPAKMVRLIIQEMEDTLVEVRSTSARVLADKKEVARQLARLKQEADDWQAKAELALSKDRDDLAKAALVEKNNALEAAAALEAELTTIDEQLDKLRHEIDQLQEKLQDARNRQKSILLRQQTVSSRLQVKQRLDSGKIDDVMQRFDRYEQKIDTLEAQVESFELGKKSLADEIAMLEKEDKIDSELAALKQKLKKSSSDTNN